MFIFFRVPELCKKCVNVSEIDVIDVPYLNLDIFMEKFVFSGKPLVVKNATNHWKAMNSFRA